MGTEFYFELIKMATALVMVLGVMYLAFFVAKKTIWKGLAASASGVLIRVLGQRSLGSRKSIVVVEVDGQRNDLRGNSRSDQPFGKERVPCTRGKSDAGRTR